MGSIGLYTQTQEELDAACPYCGEDFKQNEPTRTLQRIEGAIKEHVTCPKCSRTHIVQYSPLEVHFGDKDAQRFVLPYEMMEAADPDKHGPLRIGVELNADCIFVMAQGYSDMYSSPGYGSPLIIEQANGSLRACCWADINSDHPDDTPIVELDGAKEEKREEFPSTVAHLVWKDRLGNVVTKLDYDSIEEATTALDNPKVATYIPGHTWEVVPVEAKVK